MPLCPVRHASETGGAVDSNSKAQDLPDITTHGRPGDLLLAPWRVFFPLVAICAAVAPFFWLSNAPGVTEFHARAMIAGCGTGAIAGYALTALPGWDGGRVPDARIFLSLAGLWLLARYGELADSGWPLGLPFGILLAAVLLRRGRRGYLRRWPVATAGLVLSMPVPPALALTAITALIALIASRAVPAFLASAAHLRAPAFGWHGAALAGLVVMGGWWPVLCLLAGVLALAVMLNWPLRGARWDVSRGAGLMLIMAWLWLAVGLILSGLSMLFPYHGLRVAAVHILAMGAMGGMIQAISARVAMPRRDGVPMGSARVLTGFALIWLAVPMRLLLPFDDGALYAALILWAAGWMVYLFALWPQLWGVPRRPAFSGQRPQV